MLITGGQGNLGISLIQVFPKAMTPTHAELDVGDRDAVFRFLEAHREIKIIIHAAALADVRACEEDREAAWRSNVEGTRNLVEASLNLNPKIYFVYMSTACVFEGTRGMYIETDTPYPQNFYSLTKLIGEFIAERLKDHLIIRTNFVPKKTWPFPKAFVDRFGTYLFTDDVASGVREVTDTHLNGIVHIAGDRKLSMYELAKMTTPEVQPMTIKEYSGPTLPMDMTLDTVRWRRYGIGRTHS